MSDLIEESPTSQIIYDSTKSNSLMLRGTDITIANINNEIKLNVTGITFNNASSIRWDNLQTTGSSILDASNNFTQPNIFTTIDASTINATTINVDHLTINQLPEQGNELVTKSYVDSLVGQYSGGLNLYLNYSTTNGIYKELSNKINSNSTQSINTQLVTNITYITIASFITPSAYPGITVIPRGIWNMTVYGDVSSNSAGTVNYYFNVYKYISDSSSVLIATSTPSNDINSLTAYYMQATVPETIMNITDRILINLDISSNGAPINTTIITYFENEYYSYIQTSLNDGTNILSAYNTWTGNNDFSIVGLKTTTIDSNSTALTIGGTNAGGVSVGRLTQPTNLVGNIQINGSSGSSGQVLTSTGNTTAPSWQTNGGGGSWVGTSTSNLNMSTFSIDASANNLSIGTLTSTGLILGKLGNTTNLVGNVKVNNTATGLVYGTGTTLASSSTIPVSTQLSFTKETLPTFVIDSAQQNFRIESTTTGNQCLTYPNQMQFKDASGNTTIITWMRDGPTTSLFTINPHTTTELKKKTRTNGSASSFQYQNLNGYLPTQIVTATTGNAFLGDITAMNNNAIVWISPRAGTLAGRTFRIPTLRTEYVDGYRVSVRNDSGVTWTIITNGTQVIYGNITLETGTCINYAGITTDLSIMSYIQV
jgi:hypothetical protein